MAYLDEQTRERYLAYSRSRVTEKRFRHILGTEKMAVAIAERCGADPAAAQTAAILHDAFKCISKEEKCRLASKYNIIEKELIEKNPDLLHGPIAAEAVRQDLGITDPDILNSIRWHTTGRAHMSVLEKIIYSADVIEETRSYAGVETLREAALCDIQIGCFTIMKEVLLFLIKTDQPILGETIIAYNAMLEEQKENSYEQKI